MKRNARFLMVAAILTAVLWGCEKLPEVDFSIDSTDITVYDTVTFTNTSMDADSYAWDFGDGSTSTEVSPTHIFMSSGTFTVTLVATNDDGDVEISEDVTVNDPHNFYTIDGTEFVIDSDMFWYTSPMGGDPYIRLLTTVTGQDNPDLLKIYPNKGLGELPGTYTWDAENPAGTYDAGYTANYAGFNYDWTAIGKAGSGDLVITELATGVYKFEATAVLSVGDFDWNTGGFIEESTANLVLEYIGGITPITK
jgi:PKD repeat protein